MTDVLAPIRPPRDDLVRAAPPQPLLVERREDGKEAVPVLQGWLARFNEWTEIDSAYEGHFLERILPRSFAKTFQAPHRERIKVLLNHGKDPLLGEKPLGPIETLEEREEGAWYAVPLLRTRYNEELIPGLEAGLYGTSFRFRILREDFVQNPGEAEHNPTGLPERSVREIECYEFGPVTFPAYLGATAGLRSMTDDLILEKLAGGDRERFEELVGVVRGGRRPKTLSVVIEGNAGPLETASTNAPSVRVETPRGRLERACEYVSTIPWAMHPAALETMKLILAERHGGYRPSDEEIAERIASHELLEREELSEDSPAPGVKVIPITGVIAPKASMVNDVSGPQGTGLDALRAELAAAVADENVSAIVLDVDSPGGSIEMLPETAAEILAARKAKPIVAVANTWAASAAYWLAAMASEIVVTPSGEVGSIGVWTAHEDWSVRLEQEGIKTTLVSAGKYKVEGNPFEPLGDEAREEMQRQVDIIYDQFVGAVAKGRKTTTKRVLADYGEGRMLLADEAFEAGMVDRVATLAATVSRLESETERAKLVASDALERDLDEVDWPEDARSVFSGDVVTVSAVTGGDGSFDVNVQGFGAETFAPSSSSVEESGAGDDPHPAPLDDGAGDSPHPVAERSTTTEREVSEMTPDELRARCAEIQRRLNEIAAEYGAQILPASVQAEWDDLKAEYLEKDSALKAHESRLRDLAEIEAASDGRHADGAPAGDVRASVRPTSTRRVGLGSRFVPEDPYDYAGYRTRARDEEAYSFALRDGARMIVESAVFPHPSAERDANVEHLHQLLEMAAPDDEELGFESSAVAKRIILTGSPLYRKAFGKAITYRGMTAAESAVLAMAERALTIGTGSQGGFAVPYTLDPTLILSSDGAVNPYRLVSRVERITGNEWRGVSTQGVTASYDPEAQEVSDDTPVLVQPTANVEKAQVFVPYSIEIEGDWSGMQTELARITQDEKDRLEAQKFTLGLGHASNEPEGLLVGSTIDYVTALNNAVSADDIYGFGDSLPERFQGRAVIIGSRFFSSVVRKIDTSGGASLWARIGEGIPPLLLDHRFYINSYHDSSIAAGKQLATIGDFNYFLIADRIGMSVEIVQHLIGANRRPTGQRGFYAYWRNTSKVLVNNAFRTLRVKT